MNKHELLKSYQGRFILPIGIPNIITSVMEKNNEYYIESISMLNFANGKIELIKSNLILNETNKTDFFSKFHRNEDMLNYCLEFGYNMAYQNLPQLLNFNHSNEFNINKNTLTLEEVNLIEVKNSELFVFQNLLKNDSRKFEWLVENSMTEILKSTLIFTKNSQIESILLE